RQALLARLLAVFLIGDIATTADAAHRQHARRRIALAFFAVLSALTLDSTLGDFLVTGVIGFLEVLVRRLLGLFELTDLVVGPADLGTLRVVALARRFGLALGFLVEVGLVRARLFRDVAVLVRQELRVVRRLVLDVLLVRHLDHRHVRRWFF